MKTHTRLLRGLASAALAVLFLSPQNSEAQFSSGTALTAPALNAAFATKADKVGGGSQIMYQQTGTNTVVRTMADKISETISLKDFGAKCDGSTDDDTAIANAFANVKAYSELVLPAGTCNFSTPKVLPVVNNVTIVGAGSKQTILNYTGPRGTADIITIGDGTTSMFGWTLKGFGAAVANSQAGGAFLRLRRMQNTNGMDDVNVIAPNAYDGVWLDNVNVFRYTNFDIRVTDAGLKMNGSATSDEGSDIFLDNGSITFCHIAYWVGGGQGGVYFGKTLAYGNGTSYQVDNGIVPRYNREIFYSSENVADGSIDYGYYIYDTMTSGAPMTMNGAMGSSGVLNPSGAGINIYVKAWPNSRITMGPGQLYNATHDALKVDDPTTQITIDPARHIFNNGGYGINATVPTSNIGNYAQFQNSNALGNQNANVQSRAWYLSGNQTFNNPGGQQQGVQWQTAGKLRWRLTTDGVTETGANSGSGLLFSRYDDTGTYIDSPISVDRVSGWTTLTNMNVSGTASIQTTRSQLLKLIAYTVSTLPTCNSSLIDTIGLVSDATTPSWNQTVTGGGVVHISVLCNGSNWVAQ